MAILRDIVQRFTDYMLSSQLDVDRTTYLTVVMGQITIYGILLTFYQFVASYQGPEKSVKKYLGINPTEYFIKRKISVFSGIVSKKIFCAICVLEVLYRPIVIIYNDMLPIQLVSIMNFFWYMFVVFYFIIFIILFFQCTQTILMMKLCSDVKTNADIIQDINREFLKKTLHQRVKQAAVELLSEDFRRLRDEIKYDNNPNLQPQYNQLIYNIFRIYIKQKEDEIYKISKKYKSAKNQRSYIYDTFQESRLLREMLDGKYFVLDNKNREKIFLFHIRLLQLNCEKAKLAGCQKISCDKYKYMSRKQGGKVFDASGWKEITLIIYKMLSDETRVKFIYLLESEEEQDQSFYNKYCDECMLSLIQYEIDGIFKGTRQQTDFIKIFGKILLEEKGNDFCSDIIRDKLISYNKFDARELINQLSEKNCRYLFSYIIIYYSIYSFNASGEYFNINTLKALWDRCNDMEDDAGELIKRIRTSNVGHRFADQMYIKLWEYIDGDDLGELLNTIKRDKLLNVFYVFIIKICIVNGEYPIYSTSIDTDMDIQVAIINEISRHDELMENENIVRWIYHMRYDGVGKWESVPRDFNISLRSLLLINLSHRVVMDLVRDKRYFWSSAIGMYLLIKIQELSAKVQKEKEIRETIRTAFIESNLNVDEFLNMLERECNICKCKINYIQREKMKEYLLRIF